MKKLIEIEYWIFAVGVAGSILSVAKIFNYPKSGIDTLMAPAFGPLSQLQLHLLFIAGTLLFGLLIVMPLLRRRKNEQIELTSRTAELEMEVVTDPLTQLYNRRYFEDVLEQYLHEFGKTNIPLALLTLDLDRFKSVNDTHGHNAGDVVLKRLGNLLKSLTREHDIVARTGGEEFCILAPFSCPKQIKPFAERICQSVAELKVDLGSITLHPTISIGVAATTDGFKTSRELKERSDKRMYEAKRLGRNQVCA